jgi:hypothetical protein
VSWLKDLQQIFESEPEVWLHHHLGQNLDKIPHLSRIGPRKTGLLWQLVKLALWLVKRTRTRRHPIAKPKQARFLIFADTLNQMNALDTTIDGLRDLGEPVLAIAKSDYRNNKERKARYVKYHFGLVDVIVGGILLVKRGPQLFQQLKARNDISVPWYFHQFCASYFFMSYFYLILKRLRPEIVISANDHNVANRCLLAAAHKLGIKTAYLQHASVGELFPALRVNYAFLDGMFALETYRRCERNQTSQFRDVPIPKVFLTGLKKKLKNDGSVRETVGIAVNVLDDASKAVALVTKIAQQGSTVCLRWHPGQHDDDIKYFRKCLSGKIGITLSNPLKESVDIYLNKIGFLIAGNTSLLFEAAVCRVQPIYYELQPPDIRDVYGFVRNGLAAHACSEAELLEIVTGDNVSINEEAVCYFSKTFGTEWEGQEGGLVARCLIGLADCDEPVELYGHIDFFKSASAGRAVIKKQREEN